MKDCDYISTSQLTHLIECHQQAAPGEDQQQYSSRPDDTSESQQQQQVTATMAAVATVAGCLDATSTATGITTSHDYQQQQLHHHHHHHHQLQLQQYHQQQVYQQHHQHHHHAQHHHQHHQHANNYHYATNGYLNSEHYGDQAAGASSPVDVHSQQQHQEQKPNADGAEWLVAGSAHSQAREPLAYSPWLASQQQHQDNSLQQQANQEQYGLQEQLHNSVYAADSQLASTTTTGHGSPVPYNPSAVAALYNSTLLQHQQQGYQHQGHHHHHQLEHHHQQSLTQQHPDFGSQVQTQHQQQLQNHHHHLHQHHHKATWLHSSGVPLVSVSSPPELHERAGVEANLDNQHQQPQHEDGEQRHMGHSLASFLPGTAQTNHHLQHSPNSSSNSSSSSSMMNMSPSSGDNSELPVTTTTTTVPAASVGRLMAKKASAKGLKKPATATNGKKKTMAKVCTGGRNQSLSRISAQPQATQVSLKMAQQAASTNGEIQPTSYSNHHLLDAIHVAGHYKDADIEHTDTHIVVTNVETGRKVTLSNEQLTSLSVRQLNKMVAGFPRQAITKLKQRRRTLKNRGYAQNCRHKRVSQTKKLERQNQELREENRKLRDENQDQRLLICQLRRQVQASASTTTMTSGEHHQSTEEKRLPTLTYPLEAKATQYGAIASNNNNNSTLANKMMPISIGKVRDLELQMSQQQDQLH